MSSRSDRKRNALGVLFGRKHLHGCRATTTVFGSMRYDYAVVPVEGGDITTAFAKLTEELEIDSPTAVAASIPTSECYFATRPINSGGGVATPRTLLRESLRSSSAKLDELAIDVLNWQAHRRSLASIVAAPLPRIEQIREAVAEAGHSLQRLEPAANALITSAVENERTERRERLVTRVFLGERSVLAVMSKGSRAIHWQSIPLPQGDEGTGVVSIIRSVEAAYSACGLDRPPDSVVIYGRKPLEALIDRQWLSENLPDDFRWLDIPSMEPQEIAKACADGFLISDDDEFDFVREHREPLRLSRVVPYKEALMYIAAAGCLAFVLYDRSVSLDAEYSMLEVNAPTLLVENANPRPERDRLNARATAVSSFLDKRVQWSPLLGEITAVLPEGTRLTGVRGTALMTRKRKRAVKETPTTLVLNAECVLDDNGQLPASVSQFVDAVQSLDCVDKHFDRVELTDLRRKVSQSTGVAGAEFSLVLTTISKNG